MAKFLPWKAKVVHSSAIVISLLFVSHEAISQSTQRVTTTAITLRCHACPIQDLLTEVERKTGLHFVYSTNIVQVQKLVTVRIIEKPLDEVLASLAKSMNLLFKRSGQHIVIKKNEASSDWSLQSNRPVKMAPARVVTNPEKKQFGTTGNLRYSSSSPAALNAMPSDMIPVLSDVLIKKPYVPFNRYFDAKKLPRLPVNYLQSLNLKNNHVGWFLSTGFVMNDYSAGPEVQAGLRSIYLILSPAWLWDGRYYGAYGLGTSMLLHHNLSTNIHYTYSFLENEARYAGKTLGTLSKDDFAFSLKHHRISFNLQYALTNRISMRGGLAINYLETTRYLPEPGFFASASSVNNTSGSNTYSSFQYRRVVIEGYPAPRPEIQTYKMWIGWETSLSYRFNLFKR